MLLIVTHIWIVVVILAEDKKIQEKLSYYELHVQTIAEVAPFQVYPASVLSVLLSHLGNLRTEKIFLQLLLSFLIYHLKNDSNRLN